MADVLIDTNILIYAADPSDPKKQRRAREILDALAEAGNGVLSSQCLSEYFSAVQRKIDPPVSPEVAYQNLVKMTKTWPIQQITIEVILDAAQAVIRHKMNFWDAQIWAAAKQYGASEILSEDFQDGRIIEGIRFRNPFKGK